jgi:hypothetical protein
MVEDIQRTKGVIPMDSEPPASEAPIALVVAVGIATEVHASPGAQAGRRYTHVEAVSV